MLGSPQEAHALLHTLPHSGTQIKVLLRRSLEFLPMQWYNRDDKKEVTSMLVSTKGQICAPGHAGAGPARPGLLHRPELHRFGAGHLRQVSGEHHLHPLQGRPGGGRAWKGGGYRLTRPPEDYSVGEILRLAEGSLAPVACLDCGSDPCARAGSCRTSPSGSGLTRSSVDIWTR